MKLLFLPLSYIWVDYNVFVVPVFVVVNFFNFELKLSEEPLGQCQSNLAQSNIMFRRFKLKFSENAFKTLINIFFRTTGPPVSSKHGKSVQLGVATFFKWCCWEQSNWNMRLKLGDFLTGMNFSIETDYKLIISKPFRTYNKEYSVSACVSQNLFVCLGTIHVRPTRKFSLMWIRHHCCWRASDFE